MYLDGVTYLHIVTIFEGWSASVNMVMCVLTEATTLTCRTISGELAGCSVVLYSLRTGCIETGYITR